MANFDLISEINLQLATGAAKSLKDQINSSISNINVPVKLVLSKNDPKLTKLLDTTLKTIKVGLSVSNSQKSKLDFLKKTHVIPVQFNIKNADEIDKKIDSIKEKHTVSFDMKIDAGIPKKIRDITNELSAIGNNNAFITTIDRLNRVIKSFAVGAEKLAISLKEIRDQAKAGGLEISLKDASRAIVRDQRQRGAKSSVLSESLSEVERLAGKTNSQSISRAGGKPIGVTGVMEDAGVFNFIDQVRQKIQKQLQDEIKEDIKGLSGINFRQKYGEPGADLRATIVRAFGKENGLKDNALRQITNLNNTLNDIDPQVAELLKEYINKLDFSKSKISGIKNSKTAGAAKSNFDEIFSDLFQNPKSRSATSTTSSFFSQVEIVKSNLEKIKTLEEQVGKIEFGNVDQRTQKAIVGNISKLIEESKNELLDIVGTSDAAIRSNATTIASRVVQSLDSQIKQQKIYAGEISKTKNQIQDLKNSGLDYGKTIDLLNKKLERLSQITSTEINPIQVIREDEEIARVGRLEKIAAEAAFKIGERFKNVDISALTLGRGSDLTRIFKQPKLQFAKNDTTADVREKTGEAEVRASQLLGVYKMLMSAQSELVQKERELKAQQGDTTPIANYRNAVESLLSEFRVSKDSVLQLEQSLKSLNAQFGFDLKVSSTFDKLSQSAEFAKNEIQGLIDVYKNAFSIKNVDSIINSSPSIAGGLEANLRRRASDLTNTIESIKGNTSLTSGQQQQQIKSAINQATTDARESASVLIGVVDRYISTLVKIDKSANDLGEMNLSDKIKEAITDAERLTLEFINAGNAAERISKGKELTTAISSSSYNENLIKAVSTELRNIQNLDASDYGKTIYLIRSKINGMANGVRPLEIIRKDAEIKKMKDLELEASKLNQKIKTAIDPRVFTGSNEVQDFFENLKASGVQLSGTSSIDVKQSLGVEEKRVNDIIQLYKTLKTQRDDIEKRRTQLSTAGINTAEIDKYSNSLNNIISTFDIATGSVFDLNAQITNLYNLTQAKIGIDTQFQSIKSKTTVAGDALKQLIDQYNNFSNLKAAQSIGSNTDVANVIQTKLGGIVSKLNTDIDNIISSTDTVAEKTAKINSLISLSTRQAGDIFRDVGTIDNYIKRIEILKKKASEVKLTDLVTELDSLKSGVGPALNNFLERPGQATSQSLSELLNGGTAKLDDIAQKITTVKNSAKSAESAYASFLNKISTKVAAGRQDSMFGIIKSFGELKKAQYDTAKSNPTYNNRQEYFSGLELTLKNDVAQAKDLQITVSNFLKFINNQRGFAKKTGFNPFQGIVNEYNQQFRAAFKEFGDSIKSSGSDVDAQQRAFEKLTYTLAKLGGEYNATRDSITQTIKTVDTLDRSIIKVTQDTQSLSDRGLDLTSGYKDISVGGFGGTEKIKALIAKIESEKANIATDISRSIAGGTDGVTAVRAGLEKYNKLSAEFNSTVKDIKNSADEVNRLQDSITGKSAFFDANRLTQSTTALSSLQSAFEGLVNRLAGGAITVTQFKDQFTKLNEAVDYASSNELKLLKYASSIDRLEASLSFDSTAVIDRTSVSSILSKLKTDIMNTPIAAYSSANPSAAAFDENELRKKIASQTYIIRARQAVNEEIGKYINKFDDRIFESGGSAYSQVRDVFQRGKTDLENIIGQSGTNIPGKGFNIFSGLKSDNINEFRDAVAALRKEFDKAYKTSAINALGGNIGEFAKAAGLATKRLSAFLVAASPIYAITSGMRDAITVAVDLDKQFTRLEQIIAGSSSSFDATKRSLDSLTQTILNLGKTLGVSSLEVAKSADVLAQAGIQGKKLEQVLTAVAKARLGPTFGDSAQISEAVIASFNQFEIGASKVEDLLGGISQVAAQYAVEADGITKAIRRAGGAFAAARADGQDYFSALSEFVGTFTVLKQETREADETLATSLRNVLNRLQRSNVQKFLKEKYNINLLNEENQFKGFLPAIEEVAQKIKDLNIKSGDPRFAELIEKLSGPLQSSRLKSLLQDIGDVRKVVTDFQKGSDILDRDVSIAFGSIENKIIRAKEAVIQLFTEIARSEPVKVLVETFTLLTKSLTTVVKTLGELSQSLGAIGKIAVVAGIGATVPKLLKSKFIDTAVKYYQIGLGRDRVIGANNGGLVPGTGPNVDTEPYMLTKGEYVINRNAVSAYGKGFLDKLNAGKIKRANKGSGPIGMIGSILSYFKSGSNVPQDLAKDFMEQRKAISKGDESSLVKTTDQAVGVLMDFIKEIPGMAKALEQSFADAGIEAVDIPKKIVEIIDSASDTVHARVRTSASAPPVMQLPKDKLEQGISPEVIKHEAAHIIDNLLGKTVNVSSGKKNYFGLEETASQLGMSVDAVRQARESGQIKGFQDRGSWKFSDKDINNYRSAMGLGVPKQETARLASDAPGTFQDMLSKWFSEQISGQVGSANKSTGPQEVFAELLRQAPPELRAIISSSTDTAAVLNKLEDYLKSFGLTLSSAGHVTEKFIESVLKEDPSEKSNVNLEGTQNQSSVSTIRNPSIERVDANTITPKNTGGAGLGWTSGYKPPSDGGNSSVVNTNGSNDPKKPVNLLGGMISKIGGWTTVLTVGIAALGAYASSSKDASDSATALAEALAKAAVAVGVFELANTTLKGIDFGKLKEMIPQSIKDRVGGVAKIPGVGKAFEGLSRFGGSVKDLLSPNPKTAIAGGGIKGLNLGRQISIPPSSIGKVLGGLAKFGKGLFIAFELMSAYSGALAKSTDEQMKTTTSEKEALELLKKRKNLEKASTGLKVAGAAAGGAALGSMVLPGVGTAVGAVLGFLYGISDAFTDSAIYKSLSSAMSGIGDFLGTLADGFGIAIGQVGAIFSYIDEKTATAISLILGGGEKNKADENKKRKREELQVTSQANVNSLQSELKANRRAGISGLTRTGINTLAGKNNSNSLISKTQQLYSMASTDDEKEVVKQNLESIKEIFESLTPAQKTEIINAAGDGADKLNKMFKDMDIKFDLTEEIAKASMNKVELFFMKIRTLTQNLSGLLDSVDASVESYGKMFSNIMGEPQTTGISESSFSVAKSGGQLYGPALTEFENLFKQFSNFNPEAGAAAMSEYKSASSVRKMGLDIAQGKMFGDKELGSMGGNVENLQNILVDNFANNLGNAPKEIRDMLNEKFSQFLEGSTAELQDAIGSGSVDPKKIVEVLNKFPEVADQGAIDLLKRFNESNVKFEQQLMEQTRKRLEIESKNNELLISNVDKQKSLIEFNNKAAGKSDSEVNINQARNLDAQRQAIMLRGTGLGGGASTADMSNRYQQIVNQERRFGATPETQFQKDAIKKTLESVASGTDEFSASMREFEKVAERAKRSSDKLTGALLGTDEELVNSIRGAQAYQKAQSGGSASVLQMSESERKALSNYISGDEEKTLGLQKSLGIAPRMTNTPEADAVRGQIASQIEANNALISINTDLSNSIGGLSASMIQNRDAIITLSTQVNVFNQAVGNVANQFANMPKEISHKHEFYVPPITVNVTASESVNGLSPATQQMVTSLVEKKINDFATSMAGANPDITIPRGVGSPRASRS